MFRKIFDVFEDLPLGDAVRCRAVVRLMLQVARQGRQGPAVPAESQAERRYMASEEGIAVTMRMQGMPCAKVAKVIKTRWCFLRFHHF